MVKNISRFTVGTFSCGLILIFCACMSQMAVDKNTSTKPIPQNINQASNKSSDQSGIETKDQEQKEKADITLSNNMLSRVEQTQ
jgi:hypothetical protein